MEDRDGGGSQAENEPRHRGRVHTQNQEQRGGWDCAGGQSQAAVTQRPSTGDVYEFTPGHFPISTQEVFKFKIVSEA